MAAQRTTISGQGAKERRKYIHFDALLFLVSFVKGIETSSNVSHSENHEEQELSRGTSSNIQERNSTSVPTVDEMARSVRPNKSKKQNVTSYERSLLNILQTKQNDELNKDKNFALMLVPMLGKLNEEQKHYAKVEIFNVMRNARYFNPPPQPDYGDTFQRQHQQAPSQVQSIYGQTANQNLHSHYTGPMQSFYNDFAGRVMSPSSASGSDLFDLSNQ